MCLGDTSAWPAGLGLSGWGPLNEKDTVVVPDTLLDARHALRAPLSAQCGLHAWHSTSRVQQALPLPSSSARMHCCRKGCSAPVSARDRPAG